MNRLKAAARPPRKKACHPFFRRDDRLATGRGTTLLVRSRMPESAARQPRSIGSNRFLRQTNTLQSPKTGPIDPNLVRSMDSRPFSASNAPLPERHPITGVNRNGVLGCSADRRLPPAASAVPLPGEFGPRLRLRRTIPQLSVATTDADVPFRSVITCSATLPYCSCSQRFRYEMNVIYLSLTHCSVLTAPARKFSGGILSNLPLPAN